MTGLPPGASIAVNAVGPDAEFIATEAVFVAEQLAREEIEKFWLPDQTVEAERLRAEARELRSMFLDKRNDG
jgi:hypothetical protein